MMKLVAFSIILLVMATSCTPLEMEAFTKSLTGAAQDTIGTFNTEYGSGATTSLMRGPKGMVSIERYRGRINSLYDQGKITESSRDNRLQALFSRYDEYKAGRMSEADFAEYAENLTEP